jgi:hypothetical protein
VRANAQPVSTGISGALSLALEKLVSQENGDSVRRDSIRASRSRASYLFPLRSDGKPA